MGINWCVCVCVCVCVFPFQKHNWFFLVIYKFLSLQDNYQTYLLIADDYDPQWILKIVPTCGLDH